MFEQLVPDRNLAIVSDSEGRMGIANAEDTVTTETVPGQMKMRLEGCCLAIVRQTEKPDQSTRRLHRIRDMEDLQMYARRYRRKTVVVTLDKKGRLFISDRSFDTLYDARDWLRDRYGEWLVLTLDGYRLLPRPEDTDPFSVQIALKESFITANGNRVSGLFRRWDAMMYEWICIYNPSGYYVVGVLQRCEMIDRGIRSAAGDVTFRGTSHIGDYLVYEKFLDGSTQLIHITSTLAQARDYIADQQGLWLVARQIDLVDRR